MCTSSLDNDGWQHQISEVQLVPTFGFSCSLHILRHNNSIVDRQTNLALRLYPIEMLRVNEPLSLNPIPWKCSRLLAHFVKEDPSKTLSKDISKVLVWRHVTILSLQHYLMWSWHKVEVMPCRGSYPPHAGTPTILLPLLIKRWVLGSPLPDACVLSLLQ